MKDRQCLVHLMFLNEWKIESQACFQWTFRGQSFALDLDQRFFCNLQPQALGGKSRQKLPRQMSMEAVDTCRLYIISQMAEPPLDPRTSMEASLACAISSEIFTL